MSNEQVSNEPIASNAYRLLWAGFAAILAAGVGFGIRGGILANWGRDFGFTGAELGAIGGSGFTGFCFGIIVGGVVADKIGYGKLVVAALLFHVISAFVTLGATVGSRTKLHTISCTGARLSLPSRTVPSRPSPILWSQVSSRIIGRITSISSMRAGRPVSCLAASSVG